MLPAFRPDKALTVNPARQLQPVGRAAFRRQRTWTSTAFQRIHHARWKNAMTISMRRAAGLSDHGMNHCFADFCSEKTAAGIFDQARKSAAVSPLEHSQFASFMMVFFGHLDAAARLDQAASPRRAAQQQHRLLKQLGPDTGFDSIGDFPQAQTLAAYLNRLDSKSLPKTIIYNLNPADNYAFATMIGNFQDGTVPGKIQFGSGWWFLDQKEGMEWQMNALSNLGLLSRFIGMITDSRSFMSYPRHEYFRRTLCNLIGRDIEAGLIPDDEKLVGPMIHNICYRQRQKLPGVSRRDRRGARKKVRRQVTVTDFPAGPISTLKSPGRIVTLRPCHARRFGFAARF